MKTRIQKLLVGAALVGAATLVQAQFFNWTVNRDGTCTITRYVGPGGAVTIPNSIAGMTVVSIGYNAFSGNSFLTNVTIPDSVTSIESGAFAACSGLTSVTFPASVTNVGSGAFAACLGLTALTVDPANSFYSSANGVLFDKNPTTLIEFPGGRGGSYAIPASVTSIGREAFWGCSNLTSVSIGNGVTNIGIEAFAACSGLTSVTFPASVTSIEFFAFSDCSSLTSVTIPASVTNVGSGAFMACFDLTAITVDPANSFYSSVDGVLFDKNQTTLIQFPGGRGGSYTLPASVIRIGDAAFWGCTMTSVTIGNSVTYIGRRAFNRCTRLGAVYFMGNAPSFNSTVLPGFETEPNVTVYYLPGTTGWGATFDSAPTFPWYPLIQSSGPGFGVGPGGFGFTITFGTADISVVVEACTNLANASWVPLQSLNLTNGAFYFSDPNWTNYPARFYRIRSP